MEKTEHRSKILILSLTYFPNFVGGAEIAIKEITDRLPEYDFDMITLRLDEQSPKFERIGNINIYRIGLSGKINPNKSLPLKLRLTKYLFPILVLTKGVVLHRKNKYKIFWSMMAAYAGFAGLFLKIIFPKVKFLLTLQEGDPPEYILNKVKRINFLFKKIFTVSDQIQTISTFLSDFAKSINPNTKPEIIPNGVDLKIFNKRTRKEFKPQEKIILVTASRLVPKNGIKDIINSLSITPKNTYLKIIGTGYLFDDLYLLTEKLNLIDRVEFLGQKNQKEISEIYQSCDVFIRPSLSEGLGNAFLEAMACGLPIIATNVGGIKDFLIDEKTGLVVHPNDPKSIAVAIEKIKDKKLYNSISENGFKMVENIYSWNSISLQMKNIFERLLL